MTKSLLTGPGAFRLLLALLVVVSHLSSINIGRPAVFAFFMLSGYWVLRMYDEKYQKTSAFYASRFLRIWPPFAIAFLLAYAASALLSEPPAPQILSGLLLFGIATTGQDVLGTAWSLDLELQFYLTVPLFWMLLRQPLSTRSVLYYLLLAGLVTVLAWYLMLDLGLHSFLAYLPSFLAGALIWKAARPVSGRSAVLSLTSFILIGVLVYSLPSTRGLLIKPLPNVIHEDLFGMAWVMCLVPFVAWNIRQKSSALDMHFGNFSYALYIVHWPVIVLLRPFFGQVTAIDKLALLGISLAISLLFYILCDRRWERLRQSLLRQKQTA